MEEEEKGGGGRGYLEDIIYVSKSTRVRYEISVPLKKTEDYI
jgi:hypothetical protein